MKKILLSTVALIIGSFSLIAQQDLTLYELRSVPQANMLNASRMPYANGYLLLPGLSGVYTTFYSNGFNYSDAIRRGSDDSLYLEADKAISRMNTLNDIGTDFRTTIFGFGFRTGATYITFNIEEKASARTTYPKTLAEFFWYGNADPRFLDQRTSIAGLAGDYLQYTEVSLGWARDVNEELTIGARLKYLSGHANLTTTVSDLGLTTRSQDAAYSLEVDGNFSYKSAGAMGAILDSGKTIEEGIDEATNLDNIGSLTGNHGGAIDIGVTYRFNNRWSVSAAVNDIGMISWSESVTNGTAENIDITYDGEDVNNWVEQGIGPGGIGKFVDTLFESIDFDYDQKAYTTWLPTKIYLGGNFRVLQKVDLSVLSYNEIYNGKFRTSMRAAVSYRLRNWLMATANYSLYGRSASNVGVGFSANAGPIQLYAVSDNIVSYLLPKQNKNFHLRFGINLTFANNFSQN